MWVIRYVELLAIDLGSLSKSSMLKAEKCHTKKEMH